MRVLWRIQSSSESVALKPLDCSGLLFADAGGNLTAKFDSSSINAMHFWRVKYLWPRNFTGDIHMTTNFTSRTRAVISTAALALSLTYAMPAFAQDSQPPAVAAQAAPQVVTAWGIATNDLTPDPAVRYGVLPNGMKYALQQNQTLKGNASVRFAFNVGFRDEEDNENGIAHVVEHMAFNGSTNIPEGELVKKLERLGLKFGADTNASTDMTTTMYKLDLPKTDPETIDFALLAMREVASELTISPAAVDRERGVILSERQARNDINRKLAADFLNTMLPGTRFGQRVSVGSEEVLKSAPANRIQDFYRAFYRPDNAVLSIVGDFDIAAMEAKVRDRFSTWQAKGIARKNYSVAIPESSPATIGNFADPTLPESIEYYRLTPVKPSENTIASERLALLELLGQIALTKRIDKISRQPNATMLGGQADNSEKFGLFKSFGALIVAKDGNWKASLASAEQELRRAAQFGFTESEVQEGLAILENVVANSVTQAGSRTNDTLAESIIASAAKKTIIQSPANFQKLFISEKPKMTVDAVNAAFRNAWGNGATAIHIRTKAPIDNVQNTVTLALSESRTVAVSAPIEEKLKAFAYDSFGKPGKVVSDTKISDLGIRSVRFANGVRLNIRKTDYEPGNIQFGMRVGSGRAGLPKDKPGLAQLLEYMSPTDGLQAHGYDELQKILIGKTVRLGLKAEDDAFTSTGATSRNDLAMQMKLLAATVSAFGYRADTDAQWPSVAKLIAESQKTNASALFPLASQNILSDGDGRFGQGDPLTMAQRNMAELKSAIDAHLKAGAVEIALVGDVDENDAIAFVAQSLGALPKRAKGSKMAAADKTRQFPKDRKTRIVTHNGPNDQGLISLSWPTTDDTDLKASTTRDVLAGVMSLQLTTILREKLGVTYSPQALSHSSSSFPGYGHITTFATGAPNAMDDMSGLIKEIATSMAATPPTEDQLLRARKPIAERYLKQDRQNSGWLSVVNVAQSEPARLDRRRQRAAILEAISADDLQAMAKKYLITLPLETRIISQGEAAKMQPK
jgi:zinc protease